MWFLHIESFFAFQPLFFEDLMLKFAKDNCFTPVASPAGTDDPWSVVGFIRKAAQPLYRRQSLCWLFNLPCNYAWDCCDTCWCCCAQTTHDPNLSKREGKPTGLGAQPQYRLFTLLQGSTRPTRPTSAKPNRGGGRCGDSEGWICLLRRIVTLWSNRRLDIETKASCSTGFRRFSGDGWGGPEDAFRLRVGEDSRGGHEGCSHPPTGALPHKSTSIWIGSV